MSTETANRDAEQPGATPSRVGPIVGAALGVTVFAVAAWFLRRALADIHFATVLERVHEISGRRVALAALFACGSYLILTGYDALGVRYAGRRLPYLRTALTSFMAYAVGHNVGIAALSGGSIRYRVYSALGLSAVEVTKIIAFCTVTFFIGTAFLLGVSFGVMPAAELKVLAVPTPIVRAAGALLIGAVAAYLAGSSLRRGPLQIGSWRIGIPATRIAWLQLLFSIGDLLCASGTLYVLLAPSLGIGYWSFLGLYLVAIAAGVLSSLPGGIGVFEAVLLITLPNVDREALLSTVIVYRLIYYVAPLAVALVFLAGHEIQLHRSKLFQAGDIASDWLSKIAPQILGTTVFLAGLVLLVSGASPAIASRLRIIARLIPLPVLELSHLLGSLFGFALLIVARGLQRRLSSAYRITILLLIAGVFASLLKGLDYEEALILTTILVFLRLTHDEFYRRGSLLDQRFTPAWIGMILIALAASIWVGIFSYRNVEYSDQLWWQFSLNGNAPRMLRASLVATIAAAGFTLWKLMRPAPPAQKLPSADDLAHARRIVAAAVDSSANAALTGDKRFLFNHDRTAFVMYQVSGRSWIALGDPVGPPEEREALVWDFRELCDRYDGRVVFYQVTDEELPLYVDMGLTLSKLGEDGRVPLENFSLEGAPRAELRQAWNRGKREGLSFEVVGREQVPKYFPRLKQISDTWLTERSTAEKSFSLGAYDERYLANFDCALVRAHGEIVAFANLWPAPAGGELSVDLMRYTSAAPKQVMDYLFIELMLWGKAQGYKWFSMGMAPLAGLEQHTLATIWHKTGNLIFRYGEGFYNFEGLRHYKAKFAPVWRPRYLACPGGGLTLPRVLLDVAKLISGGIRQVFTK
jgi:phosphatidylglycerol lysyltransferase